MDIITFVTTIFCKIDDWLQDKQVRRSGPAPKLSDSEVLTMEIVGEFLGYDEEKKMYDYFRCHWQAEFPKLREVHRTTFTRQAANLWGVKEALWQYLLQQIHFDTAVSVVDSFPVPVCRFARANRCRLFECEAAYGYDEVAKQTFYGFRCHLRICWPGVIVGVQLAPANLHELDAVENLLAQAHGWVLGDRNYWCPELAQRLAQRGIWLLAPFKSKQRERVPWPKWLSHKRYLIETVFGQLVGRLQAKSVWARDMWHLRSRWIRKILTHTFAFFLAQQSGQSPLQFAKLISH